LGDPPGCPVELPCPVSPVGFFARLPGSYVCPVARLTILPGQESNSPGWINLPGYPVDSVARFGFFQKFTRREEANIAKALCKG